MSVISGNILNSIKQSFQKATYKDIIATLAVTLCALTVLMLLFKADSPKRAFFKAFIYSFGFGLSYFGVSKIPSKKKRLALAVAIGSLPIVISILEMIFYPPSLRMDTSNLHVYVLAGILIGFGLTIVLARKYTKQENILSGKKPEGHVVEILILVVALPIALFMLTKLSQKNTQEEIPVTKAIVVKSIKEYAQTLAKAKPDVLLIKAKKNQTKYEVISLGIIKDLEYYLAVKKKRVFKINPNYSATEIINEDISVLKPEWKSFLESPFTATDENIKQMIRIVTTVANAKLKLTNPFYIMINLQRGKEHVAFSVANCIVIDAEFMEKHNLTNGEVIAIILHELGHLIFDFSNIVALGAERVSLLGFSFIVLGFTIKTLPSLVNNKFFLKLILYLAAIIFFLIINAILVASIRKQEEFRADSFASECGFGEYLAKFFERFKRKTDLLQALLDEHPTDAQRIVFNRKKSKLVQKIFEEVLKEAKILKA